VLNEKEMYCLITGAAGGIGSAMVNRFHESGYNVIAIDKCDMPDYMKCYKYLRVDLEEFAINEAYAENVIHEIIQYLENNKLDVLINNAAVQILGGFDNINRDQWKKSFNINVLAPFLLVQGLLLPLENSKGCVINISSIHSRLTKKNFVAYSTSKAALSALTRAMAIDLENRVRVNSIEPAAIETDMLKKGFKDKIEMYSELKNCHPQKRIGTPEEVANMALLLSNKSIEFLHGSNIAIDGGISGRLYDPD